MHEYCYDEMKRFQREFLESYNQKKATILDVGSQDVNGSFRELFNSENWKYIGLDIEKGENVNFVPKKKYFWDEIKSESIDVVISGQAFEHNEFFWLTMLEISRILKKGGLGCIISPSSGFEHRYPVDCYRFYRDGMAAIAKFGNLDVLEAKTNFEVDEHYTDGSHFWKDSTLIFTKTKNSKIDEFLLYIHRLVAKKIWSN